MRAFLTALGTVGERDLLGMKRNDFVNEIDEERYVVSTEMREANVTLFESRTVKTCLRGHICQDLRITTNRRIRSRDENQHFSTQQMQAMI